MASVETRHPSFTAARLAEWALCDRAYQGETAIKEFGVEHLPMPGGYKGLSDGGFEAYRAYLTRAQFPDIMAPSIGAMVGIVHGTEIQIEMPTALEYLHEAADGDSLTLVDLHRRITRGLLVLGRMGVLADAPEDGGDPFLSVYRGPTITNWDKDFFVLDESHMARDGFTWEHVKQFRVLELVDGRYRQTLHKGTEVIDMTPTMQGGGLMDSIPFAVGSAKDMGPQIETPPLIGVARASVAMYQLSADYRLQLFMSGQETLVAINGPAPELVGAGVVHEMIGDGDKQPDLKYVSPTCSGIAAHKEAIEMNRDAAAQAGARLFDQGERAQESGEARALRYRSETANLQSVAQMSCALLERGLRGIAVMKGLDPAQVIVNAPENLLEAAMTPADAAALWQIVRDRGLSYDTFYTAIQKGGLASAERTAEDEMRLMDDEDFRESDAALGNRADGLTQGNGDAD